MSGNLIRADAPAARSWQLDAFCVGVLLAVTAAAWFVGVRPVTAAQQRAAVERAAFAAAYDRSLEVAANVVASRAKLAGAAAERKARAVPFQQLSWLNHRLAALNELAGQSDIRLDEVQPSKAGVGPRCALVPIRVAGSASFSGLTAFLHRLHASCPDVGVSDLTVSGQPSPTTMPATFTLNLTWYACGTAMK